MRLLIRAGANIDHQNDFGSALVNASSIGGDIKMVKLLIGEGASVNLQSIIKGRTALMQALTYCHLDIVKVLLSSGATEGINLQDSSGFNALMIASGKGHLEAVKLLLSAGANTELKNRDGKTALMMASKEGLHGSVRLLLRAGATVDVQSKPGYTALILACGQLARTSGGIEGQVKTVNLLLDAGANINLTTNEGKCAQDVATIPQIQEALSKSD